MILTKKSIIEDLARKSTEIARKMEYCFPDSRDCIEPSYLNLFTLLYYHELQHRPQEPFWEGRDRLIATRGSYISNLFAVLAEIEYFGWNQAPHIISSILRKEYTLSLTIPGVHLVTDTADLAMTLANGVALWGKTSQFDCKVYVAMESTNGPRFLETIYSTSSFKLDNVTAILRLGKDQSRAHIIHNWFTLGWHIEEVNFDNMESIFIAFSGASKTRGRPTVLIG
jgi:transketolase